MVSTETIITTINKILEEDFEIDPSLLKPKSLLREDLELDSLDAVDLVVAIEKTYGFRMNEEEARSMQSLKNIYEKIEQYIQAADSQPESGKSSRLDIAVNE
jgi:acyl carrier protein